MRRWPVILLLPVALACRSEKTGADTAGVDETADLLSDDTGDCVDLYWFRDADGDGYGTAETIEACEQPSGYSDISGDCDDEDPAVNPDAEEICDGIDNDCDGVIDTNQAGEEVCVLEEAALKLTGEALEDLAGFVVSGAGDVNGDGYDEVIVGAPYNDRSAEDAGSIYMIQGPITASRELSTADRIFTGEAAGDGAGIAGEGGRDVTGDGAPDLIIGAHWEGTNGIQAGAAYLWSDLADLPTGEISLADADAKLLGEAPDDWAGEFVVLTDDVDGDGVGDLLISADRADPNGNESGIAYLLHPPLSGEIDLGDAAARFLGESAGDRVGRALADLGDLDGDGRTELGVGAAGVDGSTGRLYIAYGDDWSGDVHVADLDVQLYGEAQSDAAAHMVTGVRDLDGDGYADFALSAPYNDTSAEDGGAVYVYFSAPSGEASLAEADLILTGGGDGDTCGSHGSDGVGDINGDGADDLVIGVNNDDEAGENAGAAYLFLGPLSDTGVWQIDALAATKFLGESANEEAGVSVSAAGDTNGDGFGDFLIGGSETFGEDVGVAYLILGGER